MTMLAKIKSIKQISLFSCVFCNSTSLHYRVLDKKNIRNDDYCLRCKSTSRNRHLLLTMLNYYNQKNIKEFKVYIETNQLKIFNASSVGIIPKIFTKAINSEYFTNVPSGEYVQGVLCQDLTNTSFEDNHFDIVITEDVLEHIPNYEKAFSEIHRILKPGGCHFFTIPYFFDKKTTKRFKEINNEIILTEPIEYHGEPFRGKLPCYVDYGIDIFERQKEIGFRETYLKISRWYEAEKLKTFDSFTFLSIK